jgi:hypothetical protein
MRMYDFDFFRYICGLQCVISSDVYVNSLFTYDTIFYLKIIKIYVFEQSSLSHNELAREHNELS